MQATKHRKGYKNVTEQDFDVLKKLQTLKLGKTQAMAITKRGAGTVYNAYRSKDFAEFKARVQAQGRKYAVKANRVEDETLNISTPIPQSIFSARGKSEVEEPSVVQVLLQIDATLQQLVTAWNKTPKQ